MKDLHKDHADYMGGITKDSRTSKDLRIILDDIRSVHNVGSIFRTADGAGVSHLYLTGYTPTPNDRFGRPRTDMAKVALGAEKSVQWSADLPDAKATITLIKQLKKEGFLAVALEQSPNALSAQEFTTSPHVAAQKILLIVGNEVGGVSPDLLAAADVALELPMHGTKESLNVSVAFGIAAYFLAGL